MGGGQGGGPQPSPNLLSPGGRTQPLHKIRPGKPTPKGVGKPAGFLTLFRSADLRGARSKFRVGKFHLPERNLFPVFPGLCPSGRGPGNVLTERKEGEG